MAAWLPQPVMFHSSRAFTCDGFTPEQCDYYQEHWHFWYIADWAYALPTVAFFMCTLGVFIITYALTQILGLSDKPGIPIWRRTLALCRYLSYRGFRVKALQWNTAPIGVLLLGIVGTIYFFCMDLVPSPYYWPGSDMLWGGSPPLGTRSGWLALACMPFLFATASKTSWITLLTGITHEKLQIFHRWIAYAFMILALMHTFPFIVWHIRNGDMVYNFTVSNIFEYWTGIVALVLQAWLTFASWGPIRNMGYEFFKAAHFLTAIAFMLIFFWHCDGTLTSWDYFVATAAIYVPCLLYPWIRTLFEYGIGQKAEIVREDNGFIRLTITGNFMWLPGQHCFLRFPTFGIAGLSSHPFTICSLPSTSSKNPSELVFYIRCRGGFTRKLHNHAVTRPGVRVPVLVDGPYGGIDNQKYFGSDRLVVAAGGSGAGWMLPFIEQFLRQPSMVLHDQTDEKGDQDISHSQPEPTQDRIPQRPRSLRVILATRDFATRTWFHATLDTLLANYRSSGRLTDVDVEVHLTGEAERIVQPPSNLDTDVERSGSSSQEDISSSAKGRGDQKMFHQDPDMAEETRGRPDLPHIIREEAAAATSTGQTIGVFVCGPLEMQNDVRNAVARENLSIMKNPRSGGVYLHLEHFSWA